MSRAIDFLRAGVGRALPSHRRWLRLLRSLDLDSDRLPQPLSAPSPHDFIICGAPRTGTSLVSGILYQPPSVVTVMEPWDGLRLPPADLVASLRDEIAESGALRRGRLDLTAVAETRSIRWMSEGTSPQAVDVAEHYLLGVKWPAFWRYIELLPDTRFVVCLRHPVEVINSFKQKGGRLGKGLDYDVPFNRAMNNELLRATPDDAERRVLFHEYITARLLPFLARPNALAVRYERWLQEPEVQMAELSTFLGVELGPIPVNITREQAPLALDSRDTNAVRVHCRSASPLGYNLEGVLRHL